MNEAHYPDGTTDTPSAPADSLTAGLAAGFGGPASRPGRPAGTRTARPPRREWCPQVLHVYRKHTTGGGLWEGLDVATLFESGKALDDLLTSLGLR